MKKRNLLAILILFTTILFFGGNVKAQQNSLTYPCIGVPQYFSVPFGVTQLNVVANGGDGENGGSGARVSTTLTVTPQQLLTINVGCSSGYGFPCGGEGSVVNRLVRAPFGGGASSILIDDNFLIVAGGGGSAGELGFFLMSEPGGDGGNVNGGSGCSFCSSGGGGGGGFPNGTGGTAGGIGQAGGGGGGGGGSYIGVGGQLLQTINTTDYRQILGVDRAILAGIQLPADGILLIIPVFTNISPPVVTPVVNPLQPDGNNGWYRTNVGVIWQVVSNDAPITSQTGCTPLNITSDVVITNIICQATNIFGTTSGLIPIIKRDATLPNITATALNQDGTPYRTCLQLFH